MSLDGSGVAGPMIDIDRLSILEFSRDSYSLIHLNSSNTLVLERSFKAFRYHHRLLKLAFESSYTHTYGVQVPSFSPRGR